MAKLKIRGGIEAHRQRLAKQKELPIIEQAFNESRITALRNWFNDEAQGRDRVQKVATALGQKGTIIFKTLKDHKRANRHAAMTQKIESFAQANGFNPNKAMGG